MNKNLKAVYFCATSGQRWGKGYTVTDAKKNAGIVTKSGEKACQYYVMAAIFDNPTDQELTNLFACITANHVDGSPKYYDSERTEEDTKMIQDKHIGWITIEKNDGIKPMKLAGTFYATD